MIAAFPARWIMKATRLAFVVAAGAAGLGCGGSGGGGAGPADNPATLRDVSDTVFGWDCKSNGCQIASVAETPPPDPCGGGERAAYSYAWGRFFDVCSVCVSADGTSWGTTPGQCRMLACDTDADCPVIYVYSPVDVYECVNGACENADQTRRPRTPLTRTDAQDLCFAVYPRADTNNPFGTIPMQVQAELDANCTGTDPMDTCTLPADCRAP